MKWGIICFWEWANWIATCKNMNLEAAELRRLWAGGGWCRCSPPLVHRLQSRVPAPVSSTQLLPPLPGTWARQRPTSHNQERQATTATHRLKQDCHRIKRPGALHVSQLATFPYSLMALMRPEALWWLTPHEGGYYRRQLILSREYLSKPPRIYTTPDGRFKCNTSYVFPSQISTQTRGTPPGRSHRPHLLSLVPEKGPTPASRETSQLEARSLALHSKDKMFCDLFP